MSDEATYIGKAVELSTPEGCHRQCGLWFDGTNYFLRLHTIWTDPNRQESVTDLRFDPEAIEALTHLLLDTMHGMGPR